jgi:SAM-dependent methyltransferase
VSDDHGRHRCPACLCVTKPTSVTVDGDGTLRRLERCTGCGSQSWSATARGVTTSTYWKGHKAFDLYSSPETRAAYHQRYRRAHAAMTKVLGRQPQRVLDYGGGIGNYAAWLEGQGIETLTLDTDQGAVDAARGRGLNACLPEELATAADPNGYDVVTLWDVIEHTDQPADLLAAAFGHVAPGGIAFLETPDGGFPLRAAVRAAHRASGGRLDLTSPMYYWEHKTYLTRQGLRILLARNGFAEMWAERWTSPRAKMVKIFDREGGGANRPNLYRALARIYPLASEVVELVGGGNKQIVIARRVITTG